MKKQKNKGFALPITVFVLFGLLISAGLLMRSVFTTASVSGNIATRSQLAGSNSEAASIAFQWLLDNETNLKDDNIPMGYFSAQPTSTIDYTDPSAWAQSYTVNSTPDAYGNINQYMIFRMCSLANVAHNGESSGVQNICSTKVNDTLSTTNFGSSVGYDIADFSSAVNVSVYYRIITRTCFQSCDTAGTVSTKTKSGNLVTETVVRI